MTIQTHVSISIAGQRMDLSPAGLEAVLGALDVGADGFGKTDTDEAEAAEMEAWEFIKLMENAAVVVGIREPKDAGNPDDPPADVEAGARAGRWPWVANEKPDE